jgi:hypothetical protein
MYRIILTVLFLFVLSSCSITNNNDIYNNTFTIIDGKIYNGIDAVIAYDLYNEIYRDTIKVIKPLIFKINDK